MPANYQFRTAGHIVAGEHSIRRLKDHVRTIVPKADRALIITQPSIVKLGAIGEVQAQLTEIGIQSDVCTAILPEPTVQNIEDVFRGIREKRYDILIGIGGGAVLDGTKILSVPQTNSKKVEEPPGQIWSKAGNPDRADSEYFGDGRRGDAERDRYPSRRGIESRHRQSASFAETCHS